ncbi:hypothetical protein EQ825_27035 [Escherichia coli]|nr:hypothetical protein EQ825_27035 [Escherichia coli]
MGSCAAPSAKGDDKFITTDYLQQCQVFILKLLCYLARMLSNLLSSNYPDGSLRFRSIRPHYEESRMQSCRSRPQIL